VGQIEAKVEGSWRTTERISLAREGRGSSEVVVEIEK